MAYNATHVGIWREVSEAEPLNEKWNKESKRVWEYPGGGIGGFIVACW